MKVNTKSVQLKKSVHSKLRIFAALNDLSISSVIEKSINLYIGNSQKNSIHTVHGNKDGGIDVNRRNKNKG